MYQTVTINFLPQNLEEPFLQSLDLQAAERFQPLELMSSLLLQHCSHLFSSLALQAVGPSWGTVGCAGEEATRGWPRGSKVRHLTAPLAVPVIRDSNIVLLSIIRN